MVQPVHSTAICPSIPTPDKSLSTKLWTWLSRGGCLCKTVSFFKLITRIEWTCSWVSILSTRKLGFHSKSCYTTKSIWILKPAACLQARPSKSSSRRQVLAEMFQKLRKSKKEPSKRPSMQWDSGELTTTLLTATLAGDCILSMRLPVKWAWPRKLWTIITTIWK